MITKAKQFVVDKHGRLRAVILAITEYRHLLGRVEDLEDALSLKRSMRLSHGTVFRHDVYR